MSGDHNMNQKPPVKSYCGGKPNYCAPMSDDYKQAIKDAVNLLMVQHEAAKGSHNYWHVAANLIKAELAHDSDMSEKHVHKTDKNEHEWVGLTDKEIKEIVGPWGDTPIKGYTRKLFDAIEAKLKEKNT